MLITCPSCSKKYSIKAQALGTKGRTVKCKNCGHKWFQSVPGAKAATKAAPAAPPPPFDQDDAMGTDLNGGGVDAGFENAANIPDPPPIPDQLIKQDADTPPSKGGLIGWLILLVTLGGLTGAAVFFTDEVMEQFPESAMVYEAVGLHVPYVGEGLDLRQLPVTRQDENGFDVLVIPAEISNVSEVERKIPLVQVMLLDPLNKVVQVWLIRPPQPTLEPGGTVTVSKEVRDPHPAATKVELTFIDARVVGDRSTPGSEEP